MLTVMLSLCITSVSQTPVRITPEPPIGKGFVVLKAARLIDGTGAPAITNAVVVIDDNRITAAGSARVFCGRKTQARVQAARHYEA